MINYETFCKLQAYQDERGLKPAQIARALALDRRTVANWLAEGSFRQRRSAPRASKLDPFKARIRQWLEAHDYSGQQIFQRLREEGFAGGRTIVLDYVARVRPRRTPAFLTLSFAPGECAQVDWGSYGTVAVGETQRKLSFFVMVLCYSRMQYVEFTLNQRMEQFLACHQNAFAFFGNRVPQKIMVDNLKSAVLRRLIGQPPQLNPRYLDFARHAGFRIVPCNKGKGNEKGRVESGVGYVEKNFLNGLEIPDFAAVNPAARVWLDTIANVRIHGETHKRPVDLFAQEQAALQPGPVTPFDVGSVLQVRASPTFRITYDANRYSVPAELAGTLLTLKVYPDRLCLYHQDKLVARHPRCYDRHCDIEDPDHPKALLEQRRNAREQMLFGRFLALSPQAEAYYRALAERRLNPAHHVQKIVALSEIYGAAAVARAMADAFAFQAFSCQSHRQSVGKPPAAAARACSPDADPAPRSARARPARAGFLPLRHPAHSGGYPMSTTTPEAPDTEQLCVALAYLKLLFFREHYATLAQQAAEAHWDYVAFLSRLVEGEVLRRHEASVQRRVRQARFPVIKTLEQFQWSWPRTINRLQVQDLFRLDFIKDKANVIFLGGVGLGKTHLATALGYAACLKGYSVRFATAVDVINTLAAAAASARLKPALDTYLKPAVLILDELRLLPIDKTGADLLFQIISHRYERAATIITSNRVYKKWPEIFNNDSTLTSALLDRLLHHAHTVLIEGSSYRMKDQIESSETAEDATQPA